LANLGDHRFLAVFLAGAIVPTVVVIAFGMLAQLLYADSLGAGTYTGLEAVSNSMPVLREPRVPNARRTMVYMAVSLSFTAAGLILAYLLLGIRPSEDSSKTMNDLLTRAFAGQLVFRRDTWLHRLLHNQTAYAIQRRLHWAGLPMVILPTRVE
jgi:hypothetical protein